MDTQTVRSDNPTEIQIHIPPPDTVNNNLETNNVEELIPEKNEDKLELFKKRIREEKPPNSGPFGTFIALGSILCGNCKNCGFNLIVFIS